MLVEFFILRRGHIDVAELYREEGSAGGVRGRALFSLGMGILAGWSWQYGLVPIMQGPLARAFGNTDFSWLSGMLVAGGLHYALSRLRAPSTAPQRSGPAAADTP
jgi:cytosine/uracil/thiamine/allantoin permease